MDTLLNDYEHRVKHKIECYRERADFPQPGTYNLTEKQVDDYLFDKQVALDSEGTQRTQYTIAGILIVLPVLVVSAIPDDKLPFGSNASFFAIAIGILLAVAAKLVGKLLVRSQLRKIYQEDMEHYLEDVLNYKSNKNRIIQ